MQVSDSNFPDQERIPRQFTISFVDDGKGYVRNYWDGHQIGHPLSDNNYIDDGYRYHDVLHFANAALLGWSPVTRWLLRKQRNSNPKVRQFEDGKRAIKLEEALSVIIFSKHKTISNIWFDNFTMMTVLQMTSKHEVSICNVNDWRSSMKMGLELMDKIHQQQGGEITVNLDGKFIKMI